MILVTPVTLDDGRSFTPDGRAHTWAVISGRDARGRRVTNLVGHDGRHFIKRCPNCGGEKPETCFGYDGRDTGEPTRRDQSWCSECRSSYH